MNYIEDKNIITRRLEVARHLLQRRGPPQRSGLATQAKLLRVHHSPQRRETTHGGGFTACAGYICRIFLIYNWF